MEVNDRLKKTKILGLMAVLVAVTLISTGIFSVFAEVKDPILSDEQKEELKGFIQTFREEVIIPMIEKVTGTEIEDGAGFLKIRETLKALDGDERAELFEQLRAERQAFRDATILPKLEEWGITLPEFGEGGCGMPFRGRHPGSFGETQTEEP